jgi:hypothetical protein
MTDLLCFLSLVPVSLSDDPLLAREQLLPFNCLVSGKPSDGAETRNKDILSDDDPLLAREQVLPFNCLVSGKPSDGAETRNKDILSDIL